MKYLIQNQNYTKVLYKSTRDKSYFKLKRSILTSFIRYS